MRQKSILIFGLPRSGTTWLSKTLEQADGIQYVVEPDNESTTFLGYYYKRGLERYPYFRIGEEPKAYLKLFDRALNGDYITYHSTSNNILFKSNLISLKFVKQRLKRKEKNRSLVINWDMFLKKNIQINPQKRRMVKTVHALLNIPFLQNYFDFIPLIIFRHPAAVIYSHLKLGITDGNQDVYKNKKLQEDFLLPYLPQIEQMKTQLEIMGMQVGLFHFIATKYIETFKIKHILHEDLCENAIEEFKKLYSYFGLKWNQSIETFIESNNQKGEGFEIKRVAAEVKDKWKKQWKAEELEEIKRGYNIFPNQLYDF